MSGIQEILVLVVIVLGILYLPRLTTRKQHFKITRPPLMLGGRTRLAIVATIFWPILVALFLKPWHKDFVPFLYIGIGPVVIGWGIMWVIVGYRKNRK